MPVIRYPRYMKNACCPILKSVAMQTPISTATHTHSCTHLRKAPHMMHMHMETAYNHSPIAKHRGKTTSLNLVRSPSPLLSFSLSLYLSPSLLLLLLLLSRSLSGWGKREKKWRRDRNAISTTLTLRLLWLSSLLSPLHFPSQSSLLKMQVLGLCPSTSPSTTFPPPSFSTAAPRVRAQQRYSWVQVFSSRFQDRVSFRLSSRRNLWIISTVAGSAAIFFLSLSFFPRVCFPVVRQRNEGQSWGGGWGWGGERRRKRESDLAARERGGGEESEWWGRLLYGSGSCREEKRKGRESGERSGFRGGDARHG